ncbi:MAG: L,D-transpeptidase [Anaerolineales bacterium]|nr:L,D-transpeptidase [Anaerolineales bacterium]
MKVTKLLRIMVLVLGFGLLLTSKHDTAASRLDLISSNDPLCLPGLPDTQTGCQLSGPAAYLTNQAENGIILPRNPLPGTQLDPAYSALAFNYVRLHREETPIFRSFEEAAANQNPYQVIPAGFGFVSYVDYAQGSGQGKYYMVEPGMWIRGGHTSGGVSPSAFNGILFNGTPEQKFGWVVYPADIYQAPGGDEQYKTGQALAKFDVIQVYQEIEHRGQTWLMIGPDEWVDKAVTGLVYPADSPPKGVDNGRWIEVNLLEQTISVYQEGRLVFATLASTGIAGWWTRPGLFQITEKLDSTRMSGAFEADRSDYYYLEDVPWTMYFDEARALHGAYWHNYFGFEQSHGCVNLSSGDSHWLFLWASVGDYVYVWDPSGQTPTDPGLYTAGGA